jgi:hypothetical protein
MHPREAVQHLVQAILEAAGGRLKDDAAALCLDWHGGPPRKRTTGSGADSEKRFQKRGPAPVVLAGTSARASDLFFLGVSVLRRGEEGTKPNAFYPS